MFNNKKGFTQPFLTKKKSSEAERAGFTLIELMLVVIILGILVAMVVPRLVGRGEQARRQAAEADIRSNIALALDLYELDNGKHPEKLEDLLTDPGESKAINWNGPYLKRKAIDPWGREYNYKSPGQHNTDYDLYSYGADGVEGGGDDITNWEEEAD